MATSATNSNDPTATNAEQKTVAVHEKQDNATLNEDVPGTGFAYVNDPQ